VDRGGRAPPRGRSGAARFHATVPPPRRSPPCWSPVVCSLAGALLALLILGQAALHSRPRDACEPLILPGMMIRSLLAALALNGIVTRQFAAGDLLIAVRLVDAIVPVAIQPQALPLSRSACRERSSSVVRLLEPIVLLDDVFRRAIGERRDGRGRRIARQRRKDRRACHEEVGYIVRLLLVVDD